jgi:serine/threonine-protein kinase HipA
MSELILDVRLDGYNEPIGVLVRDEHGVLSFHYHGSYLAHPNSVHLSLSMPPREPPYQDGACRAFFGNLLQERDETISRVMDRKGIERDDIAGLLLHLGKDCPGAISVLAHGSPPAKVPGNFASDYEVISTNTIEQIVVALHDRAPLPENVADPSPIAGVQSKIALTLLPNGNFAQPRKGSGAPTTHILKVSNRARRDETKLEAATMILSRSFGIATAEANNAEFSGINALLVRRYDRALDEEGNVIRLHQEDFAQALDLPSFIKYERDGRPEARFDAHSIARIIDASLNPAAMRQQIIITTLFDFMVGNNDAHGKNFSLIHHQNGAVEFAPRYDLVPTRLFRGLTDQLAYNLGAATTLEKVTARDFSIFLTTLGIENPAAQRRLRDEISRDIGHHLSVQLETLEEHGQKTFADLIASNIRHLFEEFKLEIPALAQNRDASILVGGGWPMPS